jgi:hypothetical protein
MHTTVDESTGVRDERVTEHTKRSAFILAVHQAIEVDGMPAPKSINFTGHGWDSVTLHMDYDATGDVDTWAGHLGAKTKWGGGYESGGKPMRGYDTEDIVWNGFRVEVSSIILQLSEDAAA